MLCATDVNNHVSFYLFFSPAGDPSSLSLRRHLFALYSFFPCLSVTPIEYLDTKTYFYM